MAQLGLNSSQVFFFQLDDKDVEPDEEFMTNMKGFRTSVAVSPSFLRLLSSKERASGIEEAQSILVNSSQ